MEVLAEQGDDNWKHDDYPSLLEALAQAPDDVKNNVNVILSGSHATDKITELLRDAVGAAPGAKRSVAGIALSYVLGGDGGSWTDEDCRTFQAFFTHIIFGLSKEHKDNIPDSAFHSVGLTAGKMLV